MQSCQDAGPLWQGGVLTGPFQSTNTSYIRHRRWSVDRYTIRVGAGEVWEFGDRRGSGEVRYFPLGPRVEATETRKLLWSARLTGFLHFIFNMS